MGVVQGYTYFQGHCLRNHGYSRSKVMSSWYADKRQGQSNMDHYFSPTSIMPLWRHAGMQLLQHNANASKIGTSVWLISAVWCLFSRYWQPGLHVHMLSLTAIETSNISHCWDKPTHCVVTNRSGNTIGHIYSQQECNYSAYHYGLCCRTVHTLKHS